MKNKLGKQLIEVRKAKGLTQQELAERCKVTLRTIQRIESGLVIPRPYTLKLLSDNLSFNFAETSIDNESFLSKMRWFGILKWYVLDLFNLKTNTMKKVSILFFIPCCICLGLLFTSRSNAQEVLKLDNSHFMHTLSRGIIYFFPKGETLLISNVKDTADYKIKGDIIQEYNSSIFLNGKYIGKALQSDTVIYHDSKVTIRPSYYVFKSSYGQDLNYLIPKGTMINNLVVHIDTEFLYIGKHEIKEYHYKLFLDSVFQGQAKPGDFVRFRDDQIEILK